MWPVIQPGRSGLRVASGVVAAALSMAMSFSGCTCGSGSSPTPPGASSGAASAAPAASEATTASAKAPEPPRVIGASQILVAWKGAEIAPSGVTRTKEAAQARAEEALLKVKEGKTPFEELAHQYSDDVSKAAGGAMGNFERGAVPPPFADAAFALEVGQTSEIVESARGFHIIRRTR